MLTMKCARGGEVCIAPQCTFEPGERGTDALMPSTSDSGQYTSFVEQEDDGGGDVLV